MSLCDTIVLDQSQSLCTVLVTKNVTSVNDHQEERSIEHNRKCPSRDTVNNENQNIRLSESNPDEMKSDDILGVRLIWVNAKSRRKGVAKSLVDIARQHFYFGISGGLTKSQIAFSQPTEEGRQFAFSYCDTNSILIYSLSGH